MPAVIVWSLGEFDVTSIFSEWFSRITDDINVKQENCLWSKTLVKGIVYLFL